jgi:hypothetical protein
MRAFVFRFAPESRHRQLDRPRPKSAAHKQTLVALPSHVTRSANQASVTVFSMTCPGHMSDIVNDPDRI